jgi:hypothetical protein
MEIHIVASDFVKFFRKVFINMMKIAFLLFGFTINRLLSLPNFIQSLEMLIILPNFK